MHFKIFCSTIFIAFGIFVCAQKQGICQTSDIKIRANYKYLQLAFERFGTDTIFSFSPQKTYVLCSKRVDSLNMNPNALTEFFVVNSVNGNIHYDDKISGAYVAWYSDYELLIITQKGIITSTLDNGKYSYVINIHTHMKHEIIDSPNLK